MQPKKKILIVDDDLAHRTMLRILLEWRYTVIEAEDGVEAIEAIQSRSVDLVLMDVRMPKLSGTEALAKIINLAPDIPVIMMTACASSQTAADALKIGACDWLTKPFDFDVLIQKIEAAATDHFNAFSSSNQNSC